MGAWMSVFGASWWLLGARRAGRAVQWSEQLHESCTASCAPPCPGAAASAYHFGLSSFQLVADGLLEKEKWRVC